MIFIMGHLLFSLAIFSSTNIIGMNQPEPFHKSTQLPPYTYPPCIRHSQHNDYNTRITKVLYEEQEHDRLGRCFAVAITEELGITGQAHEQLKICYSVDLITECNVVETYYQQIQNPCIGCLVVYANNNREIKHFGIISDTPVLPIIPAYKIKSKEGLSPKIIQYFLFDAPASYGNYISFYELKDEFKVDKGLFLASLQKSIASSLDIKTNLAYEAKVLLKLSKGINVKHKAINGFNVLQTILEKACFLLKTCIGLNINTTNKQQRTPLILATIGNDTLLALLLIKMGADISLEDSFKNTAYYYATMRSNTELIKYLNPNVALDLTELRQRQLCF